MLVDRLGYSTSAGGATISAAATMSLLHNATTSLAIAMPNLVEGLNIGVGIATDQASETAENDIETMFTYLTLWVHFL